MEDVGLNFKIHLVPEEPVQELCPWHKEDPDTGVGRALPGLSLVSGPVCGVHGQDFKREALRSLFGGGTKNLFCLFSRRGGVS